MQQIKVYITAKLDHAPRLSSLKVDGFHINARWIDMSEAGRQKMKPVAHWQQENFDDIRMAHFFLLYAAPGDVLKGSLIEMGYALALGKKCWICGDGHMDEVKVDGLANGLEVPHKSIMPWGLYTPQIKIVKSLATAFKQMRAFTLQDRVLNSQGEELEQPVEF